MHQNLDNDAFVSRVQRWVLVKLKHDVLLKACLSVHEVTHVAIVDHKWLALRKAEARTCLVLKTYLLDYSSVLFIQDQVRLLC